MRRALPLLAVLALVAGALGFFAWQSAREEASPRRFCSRATCHGAEDRNRRWEEFGRASAEYVPGMLGEVRLGITRNALLQARPGATPPMRTGSGEPRLEESLPNGAQVVYVLDRAGERLARIQVLSQIPAEGVPPHLQAMRDQYGDPQVVLRCSEQSAAGVPTLRFVWGDERVAMQDIFLIHPRGVSVTLYVAGADALADSLRAGGCAPVRSREELDQLGVATPEMLAPRVIDP
ncbi:MAG: hypothetical protein R3B99_06015 [Polyangiales bacterium]